MPKKGRAWLWGVRQRRRRELHSANDRAIEAFIANSGRMRGLCDGWN
jgi:hypothetical protein